MAFRQPTAAPQRQPLAVERESPSPRPQLSTLDRPIDDTREWVLFSPSQAQSESMLSAERTPRTTGISRLSDFGSWTVARSGQEEEVGLPDVVEDADELDSLDDGLHAFREPNSEHVPGRFDQSGGSILPGHDGLGGFPASSPPVQEQLYNFERYNVERRHPYGHHRTASSIQRRLDTLEGESEDTSLLDKALRDRIEKWRLDSSKIMMEEIQKERRVKGTQFNAEDECAHRNFPRPRTNNDKGTEAGKDADAPEENETLWQRITRRVIKDLIGIDDNILSVIMGESLADESDLSKTPKQDSVFPAAMEPLEHSRAEETWEDRLIRRLAKELGMLAHYLTGSSSLAPEMSASATMDYAGIPIADDSTHSTTEPNSSAQFFPTIKNRHIPNSTRRQNATYDLEDSISDQATTPAHIAEIDYWERTPDLKTVFSYLSQRFRSRRYSNSHSSNANIATVHTEDSLNRAAIIRQHHPLVSRRHVLSNERRGRRGSLKLGSQLSGRSSAISPSLKRAGTSCASWSTKRHKLGASDGGSRNYWDIGGSLGSENAALGGVWGEA
ncbi:MAG: hypothetical protein MMC23_006094 [Stictis urceolatum]|nr:hypothetical protein [Stictis urceolata]